MSFSLRLAWLFVVAACASSCAHDWEAYDVQESAPAGPQRNCAPTNECQLDCAEGNCDITCAGASSCDGSCVGGGCTMRCKSAAECDFTCDGGGCTFICEPSATCASACSGGGCQSL